MRLEWEQRVAFDAPDLCDKLPLVADCCQAVEGVALPCAVHAALVDDALIHAINRAQRHVDRATDVLSFPTVAYAPGKTAAQAAARIRREYDPELRACMLGDVLISRGHVRAQALEYGHSERRELCYLLAHAIFHLFGYDHETVQQRKEMRAMEEKALELAGERRDESAGAQPSDEQLLALARQAMQRSYSPYSHFRVGACLLCEDGRVFLGCNIENASFGATCCAERTALFKAISEGARGFTTIAIAAESAAPWPCGICRQALNEFAPRLRVIVTWGDALVDEMPLSTLLPHGFGPEDLQ